MQTASSIDRAAMAAGSGASVATGAGALPVEVNRVLRNSYALLSMTFTSLMSLFGFGGADE